MLTNRQTAQFCSQLTMMLSAGMPLLEACQTIKGMTSQKIIQAKLSALINEIQSGEAFHAAASKILPLMAVGSLRAAERGSNLEPTLKRLAGHFESKAEMEEKVKNALLYPCFILIVSLFSVFALLVFVLPGISGIFNDFGAELPLVTRLILNASEIIARFWWLIIVLSILAGLWVVKKHKSNPEKTEIILLKSPFIGKLISQEIIIQGFGTLGALLANGTPIIEALSIMVNSSSSRKFQKIIREVNVKVENGRSLSESFDESRFFPAETIRMMKVGENAGQLAEMLMRIADFQARERELLIKKITALIEPAMTLSVGVVVGFVVLAMFLPLVNMISSIN